jgi:hypothetical protein
MTTPLPLPTCWEGIQGICVLNAAVEVGRLIWERFKPYPHEAPPLQLDQPLTFLY